MRTAAQTRARPTAAHEDARRAKELEDGLGASEARKLHELLQGKAAAVGRHELLVDLLRGLLTQVLQRSGRRRGGGGEGRVAS